LFGDLLKAVVDIDRGVMAIGGELHADEEAILLDAGSSQVDLWGINLYPAEHGQPGWIEFDSMVNVRPRQRNRSRSLPDRQPPSGGSWIVLEFFVDGHAAVDALYTDLTEAGYHGRREPFLTSFNAYMGMVDDPDGNTVLITAG
jgi:hypothetical protein